MDEIRLKALELAVQSGAHDPVTAAQRFIEFLTSETREPPSDIQQKRSADKPEPALVASSGAGSLPQR